MRITFFRSVLTLFMLVVASTSLTCGQPSAPPDGINERWKSEEIEPLIEMLESESREIYQHREKLADLVNPATGADIADVGAGSGFMVLEFASRVGRDGRVYAVDINPRLLQQIEERAWRQGLENVHTVHAEDDSTRLPPLSVDVVFLCDTYHHFEYPQASLETIFQALRPGGELILIEFERIPGISADWILEHVRAGKETFRREFEAVGFDFVEEVPAPFLHENYMLRFRKR